MKREVLFGIPLCLFALTTAASAATFTVTTAAADGAGSFAQAIRDADASSDASALIIFNIPGAGPHYIAPPASGFPLITKDNLTIDGYSQPGSSVNTKPITETNNAVIKIALDTRTAQNYRDMAYVGYGSVSTSDPVINNSTMYGNGTTGAGGRERGGYDPSSFDPYAPGEVAILGIYRATNVTLKGLAILGAGTGTDYAIAVAQDYGLDAAVKDRFAYDQGTCRGLHIAGCWIGYDPATGAEHLSGAAIAAFRHRDRGTGGTRPELPNMENFTIGVKNGAGDPRAQFNVMGSTDLTIAAEGLRCKVAGNQFLSAASTEIGRYDDTQVPSIVFGTDGDGVNDADEGNLFPANSADFYSTGNKVFVFAGNIFGLARDGSRPNAGKYAVDGFGLNGRTKARFGSNFDGLNDGLEGNTLYDTLGLAGNKSAPDNNAWILMRGNKLINNFPLPMDEATGAATFDKFIDVGGGSIITPTITSVTSGTLIGNCGIANTGVVSVVVDIYEADPEGELLATPQGRVYRGSFADNSAADANPAAGAFSFNVAKLGLSVGTKIVVNANYLKGSAAPTVGTVSRSGGNTTLTFSGGTGPYDIARSSAAAGPYTSFATAAASPAVFADAADISFYRVGYAAAAAGGQTSPFSQSATVAP